MNNQFKLLADNGRPPTMVDNRTSWADVRMAGMVVTGFAFVILGGLIALWMLHEFVLMYWGASGVRITAYVMGAGAVLFMVAAVCYCFFWLSMDLNSKLMAKIVYYLSVREMVDDRGEIGRTLASAMHTLQADNHDKVAMARDIVSSARQIARADGQQPQFDFGQLPSYVNGHHNGHAPMSRNGNGKVEDLL